MTITKNQSDFLCFSPIILTNRIINLRHLHSLLSTRHLNNLMMMRVMFFLSIDFRQVLITSRQEHNHNGDDLHRSCWMVVEDDTDDYGEDLSGGDHEGDDVLLELLDHSVDEDLTHEGEHGH